ncbi:MAG: hypothetical protein J6P72_05865 [Firmicutes bacterium]|nr:hypothetical protein [Bacillota bacterium]
MAKVKCEFCGSYILDTEDKCPNCGASNTALVRTAKKTPRTIEELQSWYRARNLPPEEVTRFFIGKDIKEPKAFGIYKDGDVFIVYKNKANGQRAVRYQGTDEAYAVNELYMRLKEEILNQKNQNVTRRANSDYARPTRSQKKKSTNSSTSLIIVLAVLMYGLFALMAGRGRSESEPYSGSYYQAADSDKIYYYDGFSYSNENFTYDWWEFDPASGTWSLAHSFDDPAYPDDIGKKRSYHLDEIAEKENLQADALDIFKSRAYIDAGNHQKPSGSSYYLYNNEAYYFLRDYYGGSTHKPQVDEEYLDLFTEDESAYLTENQTGWYKYVDGAWEFFADSEDKEKLGDDLYYDPEPYQAGYTVYDFSEKAGDSWNITDFSETDWYLSAEEAEGIYNSTYDIEHKYSSVYADPDNDYDDYDDYWDDDDDWDWDTDYDWDFGDTDWDTDW